MKVDTLVVFEGKRGAAGSLLETLLAIHTFAQKKFSFLAIQIISSSTGTILVLSNRGFRKSVWIWVNE